MTTHPQVVNWHAAAACRGVDPELFYGRDQATNRRGIVICAGCPVRSACLDDANRTELLDKTWIGIRGGMTATSRKRRLLYGADAVKPVAATLARGNGKGPLSNTTELDKEVARLIRAGYTNSKVAAQLHVSTRTVERSRARTKAHLAVAA